MPKFTPQPLDNQSNSGLPVNNETGFVAQPLDTRGFQGDPYRLSRPGNISDFEKRLGRGLFRPDDLEERRAQDQSKLERIGNGFARLGGTFVTKTLQGAGYIGMAPVALATGDINKITDNSWSNFFEHAEEGIKERFPIFKTHAYLDGNIFQQMGSISFWTDDVVDGLAFMASAFVPGMAASKLGLGLKLAGQYGRIARGFSKALRAEKALGKGVTTAVATGNRLKDLAKVLDVATMSALATTMEAGFEAKDSQVQFEAEYRKENPFASDAEVKAASSKVAVGTYWKNIAALSLSNTLEAAMLLKAIKGAKGLTTTIREAKPLTMGRKAAIFGRNAATTALAEGAWEENIQLAITDFQTEKGLEGKKYSTIEALDKLKENWVDNWSTDEGQKNIMLGALLGIIPGGAGGVSSAKAEEKRIRNLKEALDQNLYQYNGAINDLYKKETKNGEETSVIDPETKQPVADVNKIVGLFKDEVNVSSIVKKIASAIYTGNTKALENLKKVAFGKFAYMYLKEEGGLQSLNDELDIIYENHVKTQQGEGNQAYNPFPEFDANGKPISAEQSIIDLKQYALELQDIYNNVDQRHAGLMKANTPLEKQVQENYKVAQYQELYFQKMFEAELNQVKSDLSLAESALDLINEKGEKQVTQSQINDEIARLKREKAKFEKILNESYDNFKDLIDKPTQAQVLELFKKDQKKYEDQIKEARKKGEDLRKEEAKKAKEEAKGKPKTNKKDAKKTEEEPVVETFDQQLAKDISSQRKKAESGLRENAEDAMRWVDDKLSQANVKDNEEAVERLGELRKYISSFLRGQEHDEAEQSASTTMTPQEATNKLTDLNTTRLDIEALDYTTLKKELTEDAKATVEKYVAKFVISSDEGIESTLDAIAALKSSDLRRVLVDRLITALTEDQSLNTNFAMGIESSDSQREGKKERGKLKNDVSSENKDLKSKPAGDVVQYGHDKIAYLSREYEELVNIYRDATDEKGAMVKRVDLDNRLLGYAHMLDIDKYQKGTEITFEIDTELEYEDKNGETITFEGLRAKTNTTTSSSSREDIEKRRQEELGTREQRILTKEDGSFAEVILSEYKDGKVVRYRSYDSNGEFLGQYERRYPKELSNDKIYEVHNLDEYDYSPVEHLKVEGKRTDKINAKYDAELAALEISNNSITVKTVEGKEESYSIDHTPIAILDKDGNKLGYVHDTEWIQRKNVYGVNGENVTEEDRAKAIEADKKALFDFRKKVLDKLLKGEEVKTTITNKATGKLIENVNGLIDTKKALPDKSLEFAIATDKGNFYVNRFKPVDTKNAIISNFNDPNYIPIAGVTYVLLPVNKVGDKTVYTAYPLENKTLKEFRNDNGRNTYIDSLVQVIKAYANNKVIDDLDSMGYTTNNTRDVISYINNFIFNYNSSKIGDGNSLKDFLKNAESTYSLVRVSSDMIEFGSDGLTNYNRLELKNGVISKISVWHKGSKLNATPGSAHYNKAKDTFFENLAAHLEKVYVRIDIDKLSSKEPIRLPLFINNNFTTSKTTFAYDSYSNYIKAHTKVDVLGINTSDKQKPNWVYTIQPVIRFDTTLGVKAKAKKTGKEFEGDELSTLFSIGVEDVTTPELDYDLKIVNALGKIQRNVFKTDKLQGWLNDLNKYGVTVQQQELFKNVAKDGMTKDEIVTELVSDYGYGVEIKVAKDETVLSDIRFEGPLPNTSHYRNLTVPGGTNYTENEISTPAITPSIKGHASFSTDQGIGWFRSDDALSTKDIREQRLEDFRQSGEADQETFEQLQDELDKTTQDKTNIRRVLEIQSDLFQKSRDSKILSTATKNEEAKLIDQFNWADVDKSQNIIDKSVDELAKHPTNKFLQLLNKDGNWINFFIKSIVQDSAKKGYEKVLFPTGETAAKVEGHTTIADEIKRIDNEIESTKKTLAKPADKRLVDMSDNYLNDRLNKLEEEKANLKSQGIEKLKPIEAFYEIRVTNILNKTYGKSEVKQVTDEYGNTWNEITIDQARDRKNILLSIESKIDQIQDDQVRDYINENILILELGQARQKAILDAIYSDIYTSVFQDKEANITEILAKWKKTFKEQDGKTYKVALKNWDTLMKFLDRKLTKLGNTTLKEDESDITEFDDFKTYFERTRFEDEAFLTIDAKETLSVGMKRFLSAIRDRNTDGSLQKSIMGREVLVPFDEVYNSVVNKLSNGLANYETKIEILKANVKTTPFFQDVIDRLEAADDRIKNQFVVATNSHYVKMKALFVNNKTNSVTPWDTNRSAASDILRDSWNNNLRALPITRVNADDTQVIDKRELNKFSAAFDEAKKNTTKENIDKMLSIIGINLNDETLDYIITNGIGETRPKALFKSTGVFGFIKGSLDKAYASKTPVDELRLFKDKSIVTELSKLDGRFTRNIYANSFTRGDNKTIYSFSNNKYITDRVIQLTQANDSSLHRDLYSDTFAQYSTWLNELYDRKTGEIKRETFYNVFDYFYVDVLKTIQDKTGTLVKDMTRSELERFRLGLFTNKGLRIDGRKIINSIYPTLSDGSIALGLTTTGVEVKFDENKGFHRETVNKVFQAVVIPEYKRIIELQEMEEQGVTTPNVRNRDAGAKQYLFFPELNNISELKDENGKFKKFIDDEGKITDKEVANKYIEATKGYMASLYNAKKAEWVKLGIAKVSDTNRYSIPELDKRYIANFANNSNVSTFRYTVGDVVVNELITNANIHQLFIGDPALYYKKGANAIESSKLTYDNIGKRLAGDKGPGNDVVHDDANPTFLVVPVKDRSISFEGTKYDSTDAQEFTTLREDLFVRYSSGLISSELYNVANNVIQKEVAKGNHYYSEAIANALEGNEELQSEYDKLINQPVKPIYNNLVNREGTQAKVYIKSSSFALTPEITAGRELDKLRIQAEKLEHKTGKFVRLAHDTAIKLGNLKKSNIVYNQETGQVIDDIELTEYFELPRQGFKIQQEIPTDDSKTEISRGTQEGPLTFLNLLDESFKYQGKSIKGKDLKQIHDNELGKLFLIAKLELYKELGITRAGEKPNIFKLQRLLEKEAIKRDWSPSDLQNLMLTYDDRGTRFVHPLYLNTSSFKIEALLTSIVNNRVNKIKVRGISSVLGTEEGFRNILEGDKASKYIRDNESKIIFTETWEGSLKPIRKNADGSLAYAQVLVGNKLKDIYGSKIDLLEKNEEGAFVYLIEKDGKLLLDYTKIPQETLHSFGFRIPTSAQNTMAHIEIVGFLPDSAGDLIITPADFVRQMGSDFDVDKLYSYLYNTVLDHETGQLTIVRQENRHLLTNKYFAEYVRDTFSKDQLESYRDTRKNIKILNEEIYKQIRTAQKEWGERSNKINTLYDQRKKREDLVVSELTDLHEAKDILKEAEKAMEESLKQTLAQIQEAHSLKVAILNATDGDYKALKELSKAHGRTDILNDVMNDTEALLEYKDEQIADLRKLRQDIRDTKEAIDRVIGENKGVKEEKEDVDRRKEKAKLYKEELDKLIGQRDELVAQIDELKKDFVLPIELKEVAQNNILDIKFAIMASSNAAAQAAIQETMTYGFLEDAAEEIDKFRQARFGKDTKFTGLSGTYQRDKYLAAQMATGSMIGILANDNKFNALLQGTDIEQLNEGLPFSVTIGDQESRGLQEIKTHNGLYKSNVIGFQLQSALDNENEHILGRINLNPLTSNANRFLTNNGFDEVIPWLMSQDIIYDYIDTLQSFPRNTTKEVKEDLALQQLEKEGKYITTVDKKTFNTTGLTIDKLKDMIENGEKSDNYDVYQSVVLDLFLQLDDLGSEIGRLQQKTNSESKGIGSSILETKLRQEEIVGLHNDNKFTNAINLIGEYRTQNSLIAEFENLDVAIAEGYVPVGTTAMDIPLYIRPTTIAGHSTVHAVVENNNLWRYYFPYSSTKLNHVFNENNDLLGGVELGRKQKVKQRQKLFEHIQSYIYTNPKVLNIQDPVARRNELLYNTYKSVQGFDEKGNETEFLSQTNMALANIVLDVRGKLDNMLLNLLVLDIHKSNNPSKIGFSNFGKNFDNEPLYVAMAELFFNKESIGKYNGKDWTGQDLFKALVDYAYLTGGVQKYTQFIQFIPPVYLQQIGADKVLSQVNFEDETVLGVNVGDTSSYLTVSTALKQSMQHRYQDATNADGVTLFGETGKNLRNSTTVSIDYPTSKSLWTPKRNQHGEKEENPPKFIWFKDEEEGIHLAQISYLQEGYAEYVKIPMLGTTGVSEFDFGNNNATSGMNQRNINMGTVNPIQDNQSSAAKNIPNNNKLTQTAIYGLEEQALDYPAGRTDHEKIQDGLERIIQQTNNENYRVLAEIYRDAISPGLEVKLNITDKGAHGNLAYKQGEITKKVSDRILELNRQALRTEEYFENIFLHEVTHLVTVDAIHDPSTEEHMRAIIRLRGLMREVRGIMGEEKVAETHRLIREEQEKLKKGAKASLVLDATQQLHYTVFDLDEFVRGILNSKDLQKLLKGTKYYETETTFWEEFVKRLVDLFKKAGIVKEGTDLEAALSDALTLITSPRKKRNDNFLSAIGFKGYKGGYQNSGKGTPQGDSKDKAMREVADGFIGEIVKTNSSSQTSRNVIIDKTNKADQSQQMPTAGINIPIKDMKAGGNIIMLARNSEFKGKDLTPETRYLIKNASLSGAEFVVGDMPGVDSQFIDYLQEIGAKFTVYHTGSASRITVDPNAGRQSGTPTQTKLYALGETLTDDELLDRKITKLTETRKVKLSNLDRVIRKLEQQLADKEDTDIRKTLIQKKNEVTAIREEIRNIAELEEASTILDYAKQDFKELTRLFSDDFNSEDILYAERLINIWKNAVPWFFTDEERRGNKKLLDKFYKVQSKAQKFDDRLTVIKEDAIIEYVRENGNQEIDLEKLWRDQKDIDNLYAQTLSLGRVDNIILQTISHRFKEEEVATQDELNEIYEKLNTLLRKIKPIIGGDWRVFQQVTSDGKITGNLVTKYAQDYYDFRNGMYIRARESNDKADWLKYFKWKKKNELVFDMRLLLPDETLWREEDHAFPDEISEETRKAHIANLKFHLGSNHYNKLIDRLKDKKTKYEDERNAVAQMIEEEVFTELGKEDKEEASKRLKQWEIENSPYWYSKLINSNIQIESNDNYVKNTGWEYTYTIPKREIEGKKTGWYDERFNTIEDNDALYEFYDFILDTFSTLNKYLPEEVRDGLQINTIPTIKKEIIDLFQDAGSKEAVKGIWDKWKQSISSEKISDVSYGIVDPETQTVDKKLQANFVNDNKGKIRDLAKRKEIEYTQSTGKDPDRKLKNAFYIEARDEIARTKIFDLGRVLKAYASLAVAYKHKSKIESEVRLVNSIMQNAQEYKKTKKGDLIKKGSTNELEKKPAEDSFNNIKAQWDYWYEWFYGTVTKDQWAVKNKTLLIPDVVYSNEELAIKVDLEAKLAKNQEQIENNQRELDTYVITGAVFDRVNTSLLEQKTEIEKQLSKLGRDVYGSKVTMQFLKLISLRGLGWNMFSPMTNMGYGVIANYTEAADGRLINQRELNIGYRKALNSVLSNWTFNKVRTDESKKIRNLMDDFRIMADVTDDMWKDSEGTFWKKLKFLEPYQGQTRSEYLNQAPLMIAYMHRIKVKNRKGEVTTLWKAYDSDGKWRADEYDFDQEWIGTEASGAKGRTTFIITTQKLIDSVHGDYRNPLMIRKTVVGMALKMFRTWMFEGFANKFEREKFDADLGIIRKGRYKTGTSIIAGYTSPIDGQRHSGVSNVLFSLLQLVRKAGSIIPGVDLKDDQGRVTQFDDRFSEVDAANMRKNLNEIIILMSVYGIVAALQMVTGKDDDEKKQSDFLVWNYWINVGIRLRTDILFYTNPKEFVNLNKNIVPATSFVIDLFEWFNAMGKLIIGDDELKSGIYAGKSRALRETMQLFPFTVHLYRLYGVTHQVY